ncbi:NADase-type glycan-binding domain-containing protein [Amycolatopsis anabasis]|uniref:NADase-type glycan-binding domain-containing protein n=1 Tax=Amycolatopsis anabasis TaxID=1840409 RepID=UPI00131E6CE5|nr:zinc-ribbon domain-containing protein [Amycolatopsis anabasis]
MAGNVGEQVRRCEVCGAPVTEGESFCGNCGAYLDWGKPETPAEPAPAPVEPAPVSGGEQPGAVQPSKPVSKRPTVRSAIDAQAPAGPDDRPCPNCGTPNAPGRRFCRRCGAVLNETKVEAPRVPWWRRLRLPRFRRRIRFPVFLLVLAILALVVGALVRYGPDIVTAVKDKTSKPAALTPAITASSAADGHPAGLAVDGFTNRFWAPAAPAPAQGEHLDAKFDRPCRLLDIVVNSGASTEREVFNAQARPAELELTAITEGGGQQTSAVRLADQPGPQHTALAISDVTELRLTVRAVYGTGPGRLVALGEVEFFGRC